MSLFVRHRPLAPLAARTVVVAYIGVPFVSFDEVGGVWFEFSNAHIARRERPCGKEKEKKRRACRNYEGRFAIGMQTPEHTV